MYNVFLIKRIMTMIALMSAILVFSAQNSFQIAFKNLKAIAGKLFPAICFFKVLKANRWETFDLANRWKIFESFLKANRWKIFKSKSLAKFWKLAGDFFQRFAFKILKANRWLKFPSD